MLEIVFNPETERDYAQEVLAYTSGAILLSIALIIKNTEKHKDTIPLIRKTLDKVLDEAVALWSEVGMLKKVKDEMEIR